jgi:hypothetical protein
VAFPLKGIEKLAVKILEIIAAHPLDVQQLQIWYAVIQIYLISKLDI